MLAHIAHTTDFSPESTVAFLHALRLAVAARGRLDLLHVKDPAEEASWQSFPHVREAAARWGMLDPAATPGDIEARLGVHVSKIEIDHRDPVGGIAGFFLTHRPDLLVVATHGRQGLDRWLHGSVSEEVARRAHLPALLIGPDSKGFVDAATGAIGLRRVLLPVVAKPSPARALDVVVALLSAVGVTHEGIEAMHVGAALPEGLAAGGLRGKIGLYEGPVVETILRIASERHADLIAVPTTGSHGFLDALRGSTTSRLVAQARCPVLTLPMIGST